MWENGSLVRGRNFHACSPISSASCPRMASSFNGVDLPFLNRIHSTVLAALLPVEGEGEISRDRRLHALFNDLTCRIDSEVRHHFNDEVPSAQRYYVMMAHYYLEFPDKAEDVLSNCLHLWNSLHMPLIFALLFHEYLFIKCANNPEFSIKRLASFVKGANKLLWLDLEHSSKRFAYIWMFLYKAVMENEERWKCLLVKKYLEVFDLVAKFYFYYWGDRDLETFVRKTGASFEKLPRGTLETPLQHNKVSVINMFCNEVIRTMKLMKNEEALATYLQCCRCFARSELLVTGKKTNLRLGDLLSDLATPGYPLYPTSKVKKEALQTLNFLWPYGSLLRSIIKFGFRLLRPLSFIHWFQYRIAQGQAILAHLWLWVIGLIMTFISWIPGSSLFVLGRGKQVRQEALDAAQRSERLVMHLSQESRLTDTRRVRFKLPHQDSAETSSDSDSEPTVTRSRSPIRSPIKRTTSPIDEDAVLDPLPDTEDYFDDSEEEDKDDLVDYDDLEKYVQHTSAMTQLGQSANALPLSS